MLEDPTNGGGARPDELDLELAAESHQTDDKKDATTTSTTEVPDKYRGKSVEDLIQMHQNAERALSRQANELGEVRRVADQLIAVKPDNTKKQERKPLTVEALLENPESAIASALETSPVVERAERAEQRVNDLERKLGSAEFLTKHPDYQKDVANPQFIEWISKSKPRLALAQRADKMDFDAASDLWEMWDEYKSLTSKVTTDKANETARAASTVKTSPAQAKTKPIYSRAKLMELRLRAEDGDAVARAKLEDPGFNQRLVDAYEDGRVR